MSYQTSPAGRRTLLLLLAATLIVWLFALWTLRSTIALDTDALTISRAIPIAILLALIIAGPLVVVQLLAEWSASYTVTPAGLRYQTLGADLLIPWAEVRGIAHAPADEPPRETLELSADPATQIANPLARWLHRQTHGAARLAVPDTLADREALLAAVASASSATATAGSATPAP